jgi:hypothetical protein
MTSDATDRANPTALDDDAFRTALRGVLSRSGLSMRALSGAMGRDPGYVAALLDPTRPSRARPTPRDLLALSDATGLRFVDLLETLWGIPVGRMAAEVDAAVPLGLDVDELDDEMRRQVADFADFLRQRPRPAATAKRPGGRRP